jgi:hypothetical protein
MTATATMPATIVTAMAASAHLAIAILAQRHCAGRVIDD